MKVLKCLSLKLVTLSVIFEVSGNLRALMFSILKSLVIDHVKNKLELSWATPKFSVGLVSQN